MIYLIKLKVVKKTKLLNNLKLTDNKGKIINTKDVQVKIIQEILHEKKIITRIE